MSRRLLAQFSLFASCFLSFVALAACGSDDGTRLGQPQASAGLPISALDDTGQIAPGVDVVGPLPDTTNTDIPTGPDIPLDDAVTPPDVPVDDTVTVPDTIVDDTIVIVDDTTVTPDVPPLACDEDNDCPDNPPCGRGTCNAGFCDFAPLSTGGGCDDGDPCTTNDACSEGRCIGLGRLTCNDNNACTFDSCAAGQGCIFEPLDCNDNNVCTTDGCQPTTGCVNAPIACPGPTGQCQVATCDPQNGCGIGPAPNDTACDDGVACTGSGACIAGACVPGPVNCNDNDPCTLDACGVNGQCVFTPIVGCANDPACANRRGGDTCNDNDATTVADMCLGGSCRGYLTKRLPGSTLANYQGLVLREIDYGPDGWSAITWSARINTSGQTVLAWSLARITNPDAPFIHATTTTTQSFYNDLSDGHVIRNGSNIMAYGNEGWTTSNGWNNRVVNAGLDGLSSLWTRTDRLANGQAGNRRMWVGGYDGDEGVVLYCRNTADGIRCDQQSLDSDGFFAIPMAIAGVPICANDNSCTNHWMALGADITDDRIGQDQYFNDTYTNEVGNDDLWEAGWVAEDAGPSETWSIAGWGTSNAPRMLVVGSSGYLNYMRNSNDWSGLLDLRADQSARTFTGVTVANDAVLVSATRFAGGQAIYELWTVPMSGDPEDPADWTIHELIRGPDVDAAGLYDVGARSNGEVMAVGGIRRVNIQGQVNWLDGLVMWRQAD